MKGKKLVLKYYTPADDSVEGWENYSLPLGNGYFGASIFGRTDSERIQFTTNVFANDYLKGGVSNFAEIRIDFGHKSVFDYERGLDISEGFAYTKYRIEQNRFESKAFLSYPDRVFAYQIRSSETTDFSVRLVIPYLGERTVEEGGRTGEVYIEENRLIMRGTLPFRELIYEGQIKITSNGTVQAINNVLKVSDATQTTILFVGDTSYKLNEEMFLDGNQKALGEDPHKEIEQRIANAAELGYEKLLQRHQEDYLTLMSRVEVDFGGTEDGRSVDELLISNQEGKYEPYLEELYYQYGRYLLVSSSRRGTPPSSLQGVWNIHDKSPWGSGYWHNINVQMNYWPAFNTNLAETFTAYADFNRAFRKQAENNASKCIKQRFPEKYVEGQGECGWTIGTGAYCYNIEGQIENPHSGPGTGGLTTKLFWDYYDFTRDEGILKNVTYPAIRGMSKFLTKYVRNYNEEYLTELSASPEQIIGGKWITGAKMQPYYHTVGCAFDQQMLYETINDDLKCAELLGFADEITELEKMQIDRYSPVLIGYSGQIKEYREENFYGEIGEAKHRHISQLVALSPGTLINRETPAWLDSAKRTLELRGDEFFEGWAYAHRMSAWARIGDGERAYSNLQRLLRDRTYPNLWNKITLFQVDGNFGGINGITEMLLQSHEGYIHLLPALPSIWKNVAFKGLKARGNFTVSCTVVDGVLSEAKIESVVGGVARIRYEGMNNVKITTESGRMVLAKADDYFCSFETQAGTVYTLRGFERVSRCCAPTELKASFEEDGILLSWQGYNETYAVYRAVNNERSYTLLGCTNERQFIDKAYNKNRKSRLTYKITAMGNSFKRESEGAVLFLHPASALEMKRYEHILRQNNL